MSISLALSGESPGKTHAIDTGLLPDADVTVEIDMARSRHDAVVQLTTMQQRWNRVLSTPRLLAIPNFYVLMIESRTWGYFSPTRGGPCRKRSFVRPSRHPIPLVNSTTLSARKSREPIVAQVQQWVVIHPQRTAVAPDIALLPRQTRSISVRLQVCP